MYPGWVMSGYDTVTHFAKPDVTECLQFCHTNDFTPKTCYAVDYDTIGSICYYNTEKVSAYPLAWVPWPIFKTYIRNCA